MAASLSGVWIFIAVASERSTTERALAAAGAIVFACAAWATCRDAQSSPKPSAAPAVFDAFGPFEFLAVDEVARRVGIDVFEASRELNRLREFGVIERVGRQYVIRPVTLPEQHDVYANVSN